MSARVPGEIDRRLFIGSVGASAMFATLPVAVALEPRRSVVPAVQTEPVARWSDWSVDDMWSPLPRATAHLGLGRRSRQCRPVLDPVDRQACAP